MCHMSWSGILPLNATIFEVVPPPFWMTLKMSPSVAPWSHFASVRSAGLVSFGASGPSPLPAVPWQKAQDFL